MTEYTKEMHFHVFSLAIHHFLTWQLEGVLLGKKVCKTGNINNIIINLSTNKLLCLHVVVGGINVNAITTPHPLAPHETTYTIKNPDCNDIMSPQFHLISAHFSHLIIYIDCKGVNQGGGHDPTIFPRGTSYQNNVPHVFSLTSAHYPPPHPAYSRAGWFPAKTFLIFSRIGRTTKNSAHLFFPKFFGPSDRPFYWKYISEYIF